MRISDKIKRAIAFYLSVSTFCVMLPIILSYALGYQIDYHNLKVYKTGILYINSHPSGAYIYINGRMHKDVTPAQVEELKPGTYRIDVRREGFYPWEKELVVRPNMVTRADRIELFPIRQEMKRMGQEGIAYFVISDKNYIYYMKKTGLFRSGMDGTLAKKISPYSNWPQGIKRSRFSPSGDKFLYFTDRNVWAVYLSADKTLPQTDLADTARVEEVFASQDPIIDVFWYPGASYIIAVTDKDIEAIELRGGIRNIVSLYKFNARPQSLHYDENNDSLYFTDTRTGQAPGEPASLYRLDLRQKLFDQLVQLLIKKEPDAGYEKR